MAIRVSLHHRTEYRYDRLVTLGPQIVRLRPAPHSRTPVQSYALKIEPAQHFLNWQQDPQSNYHARLVFPEPTDHFVVDVGLVADMSVINPFDFFLEPTAEKFPFAYEPALAHELRPFLETHPAGKLLEDYVAAIDRSERPTIGFLFDLNAQLQKLIRYTIRMEPGVQSPDETLSLCSGSCRDSAWLEVEILRRLGLAARFCSGYLIQLRPDEKPIDGPAGPEEDFTDLHAWTEVYLPGAGWVGLDPTSGLFAGEGHIPLAATPEPSAAAPVSGMVSESNVEFHHTMSVVRIHEDPRVTKPYSEEQWQRIFALGLAVDEDLKRNDVRLTMGGEPTFVSIDDMDGEEWNTAALGEEKTRLAGKLIRRLRDEVAPKGLLHFGQGKWYPGESLPRWAYTCYWRTDGLALWSNDEWLANPEQDYGFGQAEALAFMEEFARRLKISPDFVAAAYEDPLDYLHKERQLPLNVDPLDNKLDDPEERERLRRVFERGLDQPTGYILPLQKLLTKNGPEWQSGLWMLRARRVYLIPGDSPLGLRLPIKSLPHVPAQKRRVVYTLDPFAPRGPLPAGAPPVSTGVWGDSLQTPQRSIVAAVDGTAQAVNEQILGPDEDGGVRTAMTIEPRQGRLYIFMPPVQSADEYVELLGAVEETAAKLKLPVLIEGYPPPHDPRLKQMKVTPDPGVIEVNTNPAASWSELVESTTKLYELARECRLGTEKFMLDGRHTGTGGGNHIVLGGPTAAESPFLRRPDLLRSLVLFWLNHPSLSYLFSGTFIGPTSQAPRVDETRMDSIYELEIACLELERQLQHAGEDGEGFLPWLVDRLFRNLLVDVTGNTHRAEICIDKLYSPDGPTGRLGLVEMRAFEMPPHARMSLAQQLLLRALVSIFWKHPYNAPAARWGTRLHDRFLLPSFVERDFAEVIGFLRASGVPMEKEWFATHFEFRFPVYGSLNVLGVDLELRQAIEPWYVLGEEPGAGGATRYVDSSVERLEVRVRNLVPERYQVLCNGLVLPLANTGSAGDYVCGVRYRAWQPPRCLHPTIPVDTPLRIDLYDPFAQRSLGGVRYHVAHPGGRNYDVFPVNANEAQARRSARFHAYSGDPGRLVAKQPDLNPEFPHTLDLRWAQRRV
jgi:uncharacterized protein (DUF2126 family)/transglutaminase-like putative cysteine protease